MKIKKNFLMIAIAVIALILSGRFLGICFEYQSTSKNIETAESFGNGKHWNEELNQWVTNWSLPEYQEAYDKAVSKRTELKESSDVAQWLWDSANTTTGSLVRILVILIVGLVFLSQVLLLLYEIVEIWQKIRRHIRRQIRRQKQKRMAL